VTLDGTTYSLPARCVEREGEFAVFAGDDTRDLEIAVREWGDSLNLDVFVGEDEFSTPNLEQWTRSDGGASGSGHLTLDDPENFDRYPVTFEVRCN
jgi:hypothetical protein